MASNSETGHAINLANEKFESVGVAYATTNNQISVVK